MRVVRLKRSQIPDWLRLRAALWPALLPEEHRRAMTDLLADEDFNAVFVSLDRAGRLTGFVEVTLRMSAEGCTTSPIGHLEALYVLPKARLKGVGGALTDKAEAWAASQGCREMASAAAMDDEDGRRAQARLGYQEVSQLVHFRKALGRKAPSR